MAENKSNITQNIKIALIGDSGVGKSSIALRYTMNEFNDNYNSTGGASYSTKIIQYGNDTIQLDIWDTAGQEKFRSLGRQFYKDAFIVILVYDITNKQTFINLSKIWYPELKNSGESNPVIGVAGNKSDQYESEETVNEEEARKYSESINGVFELVSAKTGNNIDILFNDLIEEYYKRNYPEKIKKIFEERDALKLQSDKIPLVPFQSTAPPYSLAILSSFPIFLSSMILVINKNSIVTRIIKTIIVEKHIVIFLSKKDFFLLSKLKEENFFIIRIVTVNSIINRITPNIEKNLIICFHFFFLN